MAMIWLDKLDNIVIWSIMLLQKADGFDHLPLIAMNTA